MRDGGSPAVLADSRGLGDDILTAGRQRSRPNPESGKA